MAEHKGTIRCWVANWPITGEGRVVGEEEKAHVFHPEAAFNRKRVLERGVGVHSYCLVMSLYIKNAHYVCLLCEGWRQLRCFIVPPPPPTSSFCLCIAVSTSQTRIRKEILFFPPFHQQFMMEHCSTYSPPLQRPTVRWLNSVKASLLRRLQSRCRLKPRFPSTWELRIEGMIGSHLIISGYTGLTGRSLSFM